jgi:hypothetical protein
VTVKKYIQTFKQALRQLMKQTLILLKIKNNKTHDGGWLANE